MHNPVLRETVEHLANRVDSNYAALIGITVSLSKLADVAKNTIPIDGDKLEQQLDQIGPLMIATISDIYKVDVETIRRDLITVLEAS